MEVRTVASQQIADQAEIRNPQVVALRLSAGEQLTMTAPTATALVVLLRDLAGQLPTAKARRARAGRTSIMR